MREMIRQWCHDGVRKRLMIRAWNRFSWRLLWRAITDQRLYCGERFECRVKSRTGINDYCYCPAGVCTELRLRCLGMGLWISYSRDRVKRPCVCDTVLAEQSEDAGGRDCP